MDGPWVYGALANNLWPFGGQSGPGGNKVNLFTLQPFVNYNFGDGWYVTSSPIITANWLSGGKEWTLPVGGGIGKVFRFGNAAHQCSAAGLLQCPHARQWSELAAPESADVYLLTAYLPPGEIRFWHFCDLAGLFSLVCFQALRRHAWHRTRLPSLTQMRQRSMADTIGARQSDDQRRCPVVLGRN